MDPEKSERDGWDTCQLYRYFLFFWEFYTIKRKFQKKKGWPRPPRPTPTMVFDKPIFWATRLSVIWSFSLRSKLFRVVYRSKERGTRVKDRAKNGASKRAGSFLAIASFLARPNPKIPFLGLSLLRNQTETLATQATGAWMINLPLLTKKIGILLIFIIRTGNGPNVKGMICSWLIKVIWTLVLRLLPRMKP